MNELITRDRSAQISEAAKMIATANLTKEQAQKFECDIEDLEVSRFINIIFDCLPSGTVDLFILGDEIGRELFIASMRDGMLAHYGWSQQILPSQK